jgi:hypothetical protein
LALHTALQKIVCPPLRFLRRVGAVICKHCPRCAVNFFLVFATPCDGPLPMGTRFAHSKDHGGNRNMPKGGTLRALPISKAKALIDSVCM